MYSLHNFMSELEKFAPLSLSQKMIEKGSYDNSGIIVDNGAMVNKVLFSLDLSLLAVEKAKELGCDTILTHHPAIYMPIKSLSENGLTKPLITAIKAGINVISMHLNLDVAPKGIDECLAFGLGATKTQVIEFVTQKEGYGRVFSVNSVDISHFVDGIKKEFNSDKIVYYGNKKVNVVASFCGSGGDSALSAVKSGLKVDTIVSSDLAHHVLKELIENDKNVIIIPHYVSEQYGFNKFCNLVQTKLNDKIQTFYFEDKRFM